MQISYKLCHDMHEPLHNIFMKFSKPTTHSLTIATQDGEQTDPVQLSEACMQLTE